MELKLVDLESRLAFQDQEIQDLNEVIINQQQQIDRLADHISVLQDKFQDLGSSLVVPQSEETPPPHY